MGKTLETLLRLALDQVELNKARLGIGQLDKGVERLKTDTQGAGTEFKRFFNDLDRDGQKGVTRLKELASRVDILKRKQREAVAQARTQALGQTSGGLSAIAGAASAAGAGQVSQVTGLAGAVSGAASQLPSLVSGITALGPAGIVAAAAIGGVALIFSELNRQNEETVASMRKVIDRQKEYYELVVSGTSDSVGEAIKAAEHEREIAQQRLDDLQRLENQYQSSVEGLGIFSGAAAGLAGVIDTTTSAVNDAHTAYEEAQDALDAANQKVEDYNELLEDGTVAANDAAEAERDLAQARRTAIEKSISHQVELEQLIATGGSKDINQRLVAIDRERRAIEDQMGAMEELAATSDEGKVLLTEYQQRLAELTQQQREINGTVLPLIQNREKEAALAERAADALDESNKQREKEAEFIENQKEALADSTQSYLDDSAQLIKDGYKERATIEKNYQDELVSIAEDAADDAEKALQDIQTEFSNLARDLGRDITDIEGDARLERKQIEVNTHREEARDARAHVRALQKIREDAALQETDLLLNRNFRGLFQLRQQTTAQLREEETNYQDQQTERKIALVQELQDQVDSYVRQREERIEQYKQDQKDAYAAYIQERREAQQQTAQKMAAARATYRQEQTELRQNLTQSLLLRRQAWVQELQMQSQTAQQQIALEQQKQTALLSIAQQALGQVNGLTGGSTGYGMTGLTRATSNVSSSQSSTAFSQTNHISGAVNNPQALVNLIESRTLTLLKGLLA